MKQHLRSRMATALLACALFSACQTKTPQAPTVSAPTSTTTNTTIAKADTTGSVRYQIESATSEVRILAYRGGALARMGHNHVMTSKATTGTLWLHKEISRSRLELTLPVASLVVDDPGARSKEGEDFAAEVPSDAREGTRRNLLREEVLDAERHTAITLRSTAIKGARTNPQLTMRIAIKGVEREVPVAATVREEGRRITATGEFTVKQTDFGITPFSVGLGALQVQDSLKIKFSIVCLQQE